MSEPKNGFTTTFLKRYSLTSTAPSQELDHALAENIQRRQIMRGTAIILVGVLVFGPTAACAEPLFFDCNVLPILVLKIKPRVGQTSICKSSYD